MSECPVPWGEVMNTMGDILSTMGGVQYRGGNHDKCWDILSTVAVFSTVGGYHEYLGGLS